MYQPKLNKSQRLLVVITISFLFFLVEISVGFYTRALVLVADAFHYLTDVVGYIVAYAAFRLSENGNAPKTLSFGWRRATLLGAFFNGVFLLGLGLSIALQAIERFVAIKPVEQPKLVLIVGAAGLALNILSIVIVGGHSHEHTNAPAVVDSRGRVPSINLHQAHQHENPDRQHLKSRGGGRDLGMFGVLLHILGDAANNIGVMIAATVIWQTHHPARFYADPAVSMAIAAMIILSSIPLIKRSGSILMQSTPRGIDPDDIKHDLETLSGVVAVHDLHVWQLNQEKAIASAHVTVHEDIVKSIDDFMRLANTVNECLHAYGIHSATLQPEIKRSETTPSGFAKDENGQNSDRKIGMVSGVVCYVGCRTAACSESTCCD